MLSIILYTISAAGLVLLAMLYYQVQQHSQRRKQKTKHQPGFADLLNYAALIDDGIIVNKNGSFMAAWRYRGQDQANMTDEARERVSYQINQALTAMGNGWMLHIDAIRTPAPSYSDPEDSYFPDATSQAIDQERRQYFQTHGTLYETQFVITLTWFPPVLAQKRFTALMFEDETASSAKNKTQQLMHEFQQACQQFAAQMSSALTLTRLKAQNATDSDGNTHTHEQFLQHLQACVTGLHHPIHLPKHPVYLDTLIGGQEAFTGITPKIGKQFIQCAAIEGFPMESQPGMLNLLAELPLTYRWNTRFIFMDTHEAIAYFTKFRKKWKQKVRGIFDQIFQTQSGVIDEDALNMVQDAQSAIAETNSGLIAQGYYTSVIVLMDENRNKVEHEAQQLAKKINELGFAARTETINTMDAFMGSLPGHGAENIRRPLINTLNLADLLPTSSVWTGEAHAPSPLFPAQSPALMHCMTSDHAPFRLNLHVKDLGHGIMFGPTRSGKSTHLAMLALSWRRYPKAQIYAFDKGLSMRATCEATGGTHYTIAGKDSTLAFAPLQFLATKNERAWAMEWVNTILALNQLTTTAAQRNEIAYALETMQYSDTKTLSEFVMIIQDEAIREALKPYTIDGLMGDLLDAEHDALASSTFITFEIEYLMGLGDAYALPVLLYLFRRIETSLDGRPTLILLDEAWLMLAHPVFKTKIAEWLDAMAKKNCCVFMATQHLSHAVNSGILDIIVESTANKIFLPNLYANDPETRKVYARMGLNPRQIHIIANAQPKRDYYYVSAQGQRLYQLALGEEALKVIGGG